MSGQQSTIQRYWVRSLGPNKSRRWDTPYIFAIDAHNPQEALSICRVNGYAQLSIVGEPAAERIAREQAEARIRELGVRS